MNPLPLRLVKPERREIREGVSALVDPDTGEKLVPGDCYWLESDHTLLDRSIWNHERKEYVQHHGFCFHWDDCNYFRGHLHIVLPDGSHWSPMERASNCTKKDDRMHRCWVTHGGVSNLHVDKNGITCGAGAGSIVGHKGWHGFVSNGHLQAGLDPWRGA